MRFVTASLLGIAVALSGVATAALVGSGNPTGQWSTPSAVQAIIQSGKLDVAECPGGVCKIGLPAHGPGVVEGGLTEVLSATVAGIGPYKLINGVRRYQLFNVRACTVYYYRGAHRFGVHFRWFTRRPPGGTTTSLNRNGRISVSQDSGEPYARDWNYPLIGPTAQSHC